MSNTSHLRDLYYKVLQYIRLYVHRNWGYLLLAIAVAGAGAVGWYYPTLPSRLPIAYAAARSWVSRSLPGRQESNDAVALDELSGRLDQLEQSMQVQAAAIQQSQVQSAGVGTKLDDAIAAVGQTNDLLTAQEKDLQKTLAQVGISIDVADVPLTASSPAASGKININTAAGAALEMLPGIGATYAQRIIAYRTQKGPFISLDDLLNVSGIGPATLAKFKDQISL